MRPVVTTPYEAPPKAMGAIASLTVNAFGLGLSGLIVLNYGFQMIRVPPKRRRAADGNPDVCRRSVCDHAQRAARL